jgi:hypothetical protein
MKRIHKIALAVGLAAAAHFNIAIAAATLTFASGSESCVRNCGQITQLGNSLVVTLLDRNGKPFKVVTADIDPSATQILVSAPQDSQNAPALFGATPMASGDITAATRITVIKTATETIVYTVIYYYQNGQIIDVKIQEQRFKHQEK